MHIDKYVHAMLLNNKINRENICIPIPLHVICTFSGLNHQIIKVIRVQFLVCPGVKASIHNKSSYTEMLNMHGGFSGCCSLYIYRNSFTATQIT